MSAEQFFFFRQFGLALSISAERQPFVLWRRTVAAVVADSNATLTSAVKETIQFLFSAKHTHKAPFRALPRPLDRYYCRQTTKTFRILMNSWLPRA